MFDVFGFETYDFRMILIYVSIHIYKLNHDWILFNALKAILMISETFVIDNRDVWVIGQPVASFTDMI